MTYFANLKRVVSLNKLGVLAAFLGLSIFWACHLNSADSKDKFDLAGDSTWTSCDSVLVILMDEDNKPLDTLFNGVLKSLDDLKSLPADKYPGGKARLHISGTKDGGVCFDETRTFDAASGEVIVDTAVSPTAAIVSVEVQPHTLLLKSDAGATAVTATLKPAYAEQSFLWSIDDDKLATLEFPNGANSGSIKVKPIAAGTLKIRARSKKDTSKVDELVVKIESTSGGSVTVSPDSLLLYTGTPGDSLKVKVLPEGTDKGIEWTSDDNKVATVDSKGIVKPVGEGNTHIRAKSTVLNLSGAAVVTVKRDMPTLAVDSRSGAAINVPILFSPKSTQEFGIIVMYKWDLDGDGNWDDSLAGTWSGKTVLLPAFSQKYSKEGKVFAKFLVRDGEGNEALALVSLEIGNQAPEILTISRDTSISIKDSIPLFAKVKDFEGKVSWAGWDFEGDGKFDDSLTTVDSIVDIVFGHRYAKVGDFYAILKVKDESGKARLDSVQVKVVLDPPVADAGNDTSVMAGTLVNVRAKGTDKYGPIVSRDIKIADGNYISLAKQDTAVRPPVESGKFNIVVRVTDNDGNSDEDTMVVTVTTPSMSNADLAEMTTSAGTLSPVFLPKATLYTLAVAFADSQITVKATTSDAKATLAVNGAAVTSGSSSGAIGILIGLNKDAIQLVVTAQDGFQKIYNISVTRAPSAEAQLSKLEATGITLKPAFTPSVLDYADTVANSVASITLKPTVSASGAKVAVNDITLPSGSSSEALPLKVGNNAMKAVVTAQDGKTKATYTVNVVRLAKLIVNRKLAADSATMLTDSIEAPLGTEVKIETPTHPAFQFLNWTVSEGTGIFADSLVNPTTVTLKTATVRVQAVYKINTYLITTSAGPGGSVTKSALRPHGSDYTITVTPDSSYRIDSVFADGKNVTLLVRKLKNTFTLTNIKENHDLTVTFLKTYTLNTAVTTPTFGKMTPELTGSIVDSGSSQTFTLSYIVGYAPIALTDGNTNVLGSLVNGPANTATYTLTNIKSDHSISATFGIKKYSITTKIGFGGKIEPAESSVDHGGSFTMLITPDAGYRVAEVLDNDINVTKIAAETGFKYTVSAVTSNHLIVVKFQKTFTITLVTNDPKRGNFELGTSIVVDAGAKMEFILLAQSHYIADSLSDNDKDVTKALTSVDPAKGVSSYVLSGIAEDHVIKARFVGEPLTLTVKGVNVCIKYVCRSICLVQTCPSIPMDSDIRTQPYGQATQWILKTDDVNSQGGKFLYWSKNGVDVGLNTTTITLPVMTQSDTYTAVYEFKIIIPGCPPICIGGPTLPF